MQIVVLVGISLDYSLIKKNQNKIQIKFMLITQNEYDEVFKYYHINGVAVRDTGYIYLTLREARDDIVPVMEEHKAKKKFVSFYHNEPLGEQ
ncbi:hypothetical protein [Escherichia whittamii]|nr:hypothetical protein [Escherichia whittamii]MEB7937601.1 hypothetical protein [Escherichia whittamii]